MPSLILPAFVKGQFENPGFPTPTPSQKVTISWSSLPIQPLQVTYPAKASRELIEVNAACLFDSIDGAVEAAVKAQAEFGNVSLNDRKRIILAIRQVTSCFQEDFAWCAWSETNRGCYQDKVIKQGVAINHTPGPEELVPRCVTGDKGMTIVDLAPFGVIGAVTPVTNPTATVINNAITILSGGNGVVFNPHPGATLSTNRAIAVVNEAVIAAGGPANLVTSVRVPTIQSGQRLMTHPLTAANLITGGPAVVKVALASGKRSFCAGPGNPPVIVDETADLNVAATRIIAGASFDNNMTCSDEKEVFAVGPSCDGLIEEMKKHKAYVLTSAQTEELMKHIFNCGVPADYTHGNVNKDLVGASAKLLLGLIGVEVQSEDQYKLLVTKVERGHPLVWTEQLMPVLPIVQVPDFDTALDLAKRAEYGYRHTSSIYSSRLNRVSAAAKFMNTSIFVVNGSNTAGLAVKGEGFTSFSIAGSTGEGMTRPSTFVRERKMVCVGALRFV